MNASRRINFAQGLFRYSSLVLTFREPLLIKEIFVKIDIVAGLVVTRGTLCRFKNHKVNRPDGRSLGLVSLS